MNTFKSIIGCDFEYEVAAGGLPHPLRMVAYELDGNGRLIRIIRLWRGEFGYSPPFDVGPDTLFIAYSAWAEMTCFQVLGWKFPVHIFDQHTAFIAASNILLPYEPDDKRSRPRRRLSDACRAYGIEGWEGIEKPAIAQAIGEGTWRGQYSECETVHYCEEDTANTCRLFRRQVTGTEHYAPADVPLVLHWSNYSAKAIAMIQARGMPIDVERWNLVQEHKADVILDLVKKWDPSRDKRLGLGNDAFIFDDEGGFGYSRMENYLALIKAQAWPRLASRALDMSSDALRLMYGLKACDGETAGIKDIHALKDTLGFIAKARLPIGPDGRNRPSLFPFGAATGRNAHAKSPFNAHAGVRSFMLFPPDTVGFYLDFRSQEVGVAAVESDDGQLMADYAGGDVYHGLALMCGLTTDPDPKSFKKNQRAVRDRMKPLQLGIKYEMGVPSLAKGLDRQPLIAAEIIRRHKARYPRFWPWRENQVWGALIERQVTTDFGWPMRISHSPNERTLYNFPMQAGGAEMLREATVRLIEAGIVPIMLVHDGILFEETDREKIEQAREIMRAAGREVCHGFEIGVDIDKVFEGSRRRYEDPRGKDIWETINNTLNRVRRRKRAA
jgi:DNA polymerase I